MIHIGLVNLNRSWLLVLLLAIGCSTSGWSKSLYPWNDASALCEWQATSGSHSLQLPFYGIEEDTISPALPDFVCDAVCPDFQVTWISIDADCGQSNGSATVTPVGLPAGTEFVYNWEGGVSTGPTAENLAPGVYKVTIGISELLEDQALRDCLIETEVVIDTKEGPAVEVGSITAGNCATLSGGVKLDISGGTPPYQISWGDGGSNTLSADGTVSISGLAPGDYTFIVRDAAGCLTSLPVTIPQAQEPISLTATPPSLCSSDDGTITVTMEEGFPPYTIILNDGLEITTNNNPYTFEGLPVGLYTVKVEYGFVCEAEASIELNTPGFECNEGWSVFDPVCPGDPAYLYFDGSGTANETYQVRQVNAGFLLASVPGNEAVFIEVQYGDYEIRRISSADNCFCEFMLSVEPVTLEAQLTVLNGSCEPGNIIPGSITLNAATGGTPPYTLEVTDLDGNPVDASNLNEGSYIATVRDANNCPLSDTVAVEGGALSGGIEEQEVVVCEGDTFQPSFENATNPNLIFSWSPTTGLSDSTIGNPVITPTEDITYVLNITDPNCGSFSDTLVIDFVPGLNLSVDGNAFQFGQDEITITVSSDSDEAIYTWFQNDGTVVDDDGNDTFILAADDLASPYTVVGEVNGCPDTLTFPVLPPPEADYTISVPDVEICEGEEGTLMATIIPDTILIDSIVWNDAQGQTAGQGSGLLISGLSPGSYTYTATAFSPVGITQTNALVTVLPLPGIDAQPDGVLSLCITDQGNLVELTATATGYPDSMIVWTASDGAVLGNGGMVMVQAEAGTSQYVATLSAVCGEVSDTVTIEVDTEPALPALPDTLKLCIGDEAVIELSDYAFPYTWSDCDGQSIPVSGDSIIVSGDVVGETCFRFSASNECGTVEAEVTVYVVPEQVADAQPNDTIQFCIPAPDTCLAATVIGLPNDCIEWTDLSGNLLGTGSELCVTPPQGTSQYIANVPGLDCITADTVTIVVEAMPPPPPDLPDTLTICINQDTLLDLSSYSHPYTWASCDGQVIATNNGEIQISGTQPGEDCYTFSASNICGEVEEQVIVFIIAAPEISAQPDTTIELCAPVTDSLILTATAPGFAQNAIAWFSEDGDALGTGGTLSVLPATGTSHYIASISAACGTATDTVTIVVDDFVPPLPPGLPDTLKICVGNDILIDLSTYGYPYVWSDCQGQEIPVNNNTIEISGNEAGEQCFRFSASNACGAIEEQITVYVVPEQQVDAQPNDTLRFCAPAPDTCLTATVIDLPDDCIEWSDLDGNILGTGGELCVTPGVGLNHYIASVSGLTCVTPDTITVIVDNLPMTPPALPDTLTLCIGQDTVFDLSGYGFPYSWSACDGQLIQENSNEIEINATALGEACYSFNASNACDTVEVDVIVYVVPEPVIDAQPDSTIALCGPVNTAIDIFATADGFADSDITWTSEDGAILGTGTTLSVLPVEGVNQYIASTPQLTCGSASDTVTIVVETLPPPPPVALPDTLKLCVGDEAVIDLSGYGYPYTWSACGGAEIPVANDEIIILGDQAGEFCYEFGASNACGMTSAEVIVYVVPEQTVDAQPDLEIELCAPVATDTCLTATVTALPGDCIEWTDFDGNVLGTGNELCVTPPEGTSYYIAGVPGLGCITSDTVTIVVETLPPPPPVALPDTLKLCVGDEAVIDLSGYGFPYTWSACGGAEIPVANDEIIILGDQAGEFCYEFGASNACGMTSAEVIVYVVPEQTVDVQPDVNVLLCTPVEMDTCLTATVTGLPDECIEWTDLEGTLLGTGGELCVTPPVGISQYIASVPGLDCTISDTVTVMVDTIPPVLPPSLPDTVLMCLNDTLSVTVGDYDYPFVWENENGDTVAINEGLVLVGAEAGTASFIFEATNGCGVVADTLVQVTIDSAAIEIIPSVDTLVVCDSFAIQLNALAPLGQAVVWTDGEGNVIDTAISIEIMPQPGSSIYIANLVELGCVSSDTIVVEYVPEDLMLEINTPSLLICLGDEASLEAALDPEDVAATISWYDEAFVFIGEGEVIGVTPTRAGLVSYFAIAENACAMDTASIEIEVEALDLAIVGGDTSICTGDFATLEVVGCDNCTYEWTPEDRLTNPDAAITDAEPLRPSTFQVIVTGEVCRDTLTTTVDVGTCERCEVDKVFIADAFTPNGDQNNDQVCVQSEVMDQFSEIELMIYNRWGQEVFRSNDMQNLCWDGFFGGEDLPPDVYGYYMRIVCPGEEGEPDQVFTRQGNITLLR
ncbi:gliding motility-associated C-terminal domain-containing protein [Phaeodactylibacter xiamenensis]|uniref:Uncharacterized protein n=3 Tax=Phaeodactylibacter xiamenensis TaxID=1524460 RepID=A0A098SBD8_9BACT|nr:T9SS C-terminal target domain-containing protein [Phaeodactylibacter xiamenensis]KGE88983.1 hypothetical protein IX84_04120 [Phaeodactylibacter xiamenensis]